MESEAGVHIGPGILENLNKKPAKGILKSSSSFETTEATKCIRRSQGDKATKWDEMNIIATLHPPNKDYGHMKIEEPKTPFEREVPEDEIDSGVDPSILIEKISTIDKVSSRPLEIRGVDEGNDDSDEEIEETEEEREARKAFEMKRKAHYNEFYAAKVARKLIEEDCDDDDDEEKKADLEEEEEEKEEEDDSDENSSLNSSKAGKTVEQKVDAGSDVINEKSKKSNDVEKKKSSLPSTDKVDDWPMHES